MKCELLNLKAFEDNRGALVAIEKGCNAPFEVKRVFYIFNVKDNAARGCHANKKSEFLLCALCGSCKIQVDDGKNKANFTLNSPKQALYLDKMLWKEMYDFSEDAVLLVLASEKYDVNEFINNYDEFLQATL